MTEYENKEMFCRIQFDSSDEVAYYRTDLAEAHFLRIDTPVTVNFITEGKVLAGRIVSIKDYFTYPAPFPEEGILLVDKKEVDWVKMPYSYEKIDGEKVVSIDKHAFESCKGLRRVVVPKGVEELGENAFKDCYVLQEIVLPEQMRKIGNNCFTGCSRLSEVRLPESLTYIDNNIFTICLSLKRIYISDSVTSIFPNAFKKSNPVFFGGSNSYAVKYAEEHKISHIKSEYYQKISRSEWDSENQSTLSAEEQERAYELVNVHAIDITLAKNEGQKTEVKKIESPKLESEKYMPENRPVKNIAS